MERFSREYQLVHSFIENLMSEAFAEPGGCFKYPTPTTTSGDFYQALFTWDTHHMTLRHAMAGHPEVMKYFLLTMFDFQKPNGYISSVISADSGPLFACEFHAQPYLAQNTAIYFALTGDVELISGLYPKLEKYLAYYDSSLSAPGKLYRWKEPWMSGFDNEAASTFFPQDTILLPDIQSLMYLEFRAMAYLAQKLGLPENYSAKAEQLKEAVNHYFWDEKTGIYAAYNLLSAATLPGMVYEGIPEHIGKYAFVSCPTLMPLFAGIAPADRAKRLIENFVLSPEHFRSPWGIRSLSRSSEYYNNARWGNRRLAQTYQFQLAGTGLDPAELVRIPRSLALRLCHRCGRSG